MIEISESKTNIPIINMNYIAITIMIIKKHKKHKKYIGMLIHLLAYQSLYVDKENVEFIKSSDVENINYYGIYTFFNKNFLNEDMSGESKVPSNRTVDKDLKEAYKFFKDEVRPLTKTSI